MSEHFTDTDPDYFNPDVNGHDSDGDAENVILTAPDFSTFVKSSRTANAKAYERKVQSALKTGFYGALKSGQLPDAATILYYGPNLAQSAGDLADKDERIARGIDMLTAPDNPYVALGLAALAIIGQFARNHEDTLSAIPQAMKEGKRERKARRAAEKENPSGRHLELKLPFGRTARIGLRFRLRAFRKLGLAFKLRSHDPAQLVTEVFSDEKLLKALAKEGIVIRPHG